MKIRDFRKSLRAKIMRPKDFSAYCQEQRPSEKHRVTADRNHRLALGFAFAALLEIEKAPNRANLLAELQKSPGQTKTRDPVLIVLRSFIDYETSGDAPSRDKKVIEFCVSRQLSPTEVPKFIKNNGGLVACAAIQRREARGDGPWTKLTKEEKQRRTLSSLRRHVLKEKGDGALVYVELVADPKKAARIDEVKAVKSMGRLKNKARTMKLLARIATLVTNYECSNSDE